MPKIHTCCKDCVFSQYEGITQLDCSLGKIDKFERLDIPIIEAYDDEKEFYIIENRKCQFYRNKQWMLQNIDVGDAPNTINFLVKKETQISPDILILVETNTSLEDIKTTVLSIKNSTIKPLSIIFTFEKNIEKLHLSIFQWIKHNVEIPYSYEYVHIEDNKINFGVRRVKLFYICLEAGKELKEKYIENINNRINNEMWPILYIRAEEPYQYHHMFVSKQLHNFVGGFGKRTIDDKVNELKEDEECLMNMIVTYEMI
jgi:hypothetical protein